MGGQCVVPEVMSQKVSEVSRDRSSDNAIFLYKKGYIMDNL